VARLRTRCLVLIVSQAGEDGRNSEVVAPLPDQLVVLLDINNRVVEVALLAAVVAPDGANHLGTGISMDVKTFFLRFRIKKTRVFKRFLLTKNGQ